MILAQTGTAVNQMLDTIVATDLTHLALILFGGVIFIAIVFSISFFLAQRSNASTIKTMGQMLVATQNANTQIHAQLTKSQNRSDDLLESLTKRMETDNHDILSTISEVDKARASRNEVLVNDALKNTTKHIDTKTEQIISNLGTVKDQIADLRLEFLREVQNTSKGFSENMATFLTKFDLLESAVMTGTREIIVALTKNNESVATAPVAPQIETPLLHSEKETV